MKNKICSFFGHREICVTETLRCKLLYEIEKLINNGFDTFYFGGYGDFDNLCWELTTELKVRYANIKRVFCFSDCRYLKKEKRPKWLSEKNYEDFIYLSLDCEWWYKRIYFRNCEMIKRSDFIIFYVNRKENSGSYKSLQFARKQKKDYINLQKDILGL